MSYSDAVYNNYGSKRGLLRYYYYQFGLLSGQMRAYRQIDWAAARRLVFVCMGNICRSPLAEAYAREQGRDTISFGLNCSDDYPADPRAVAFAEQQGLDLQPHRTTHIRHYQPQSSDVLIGMEPAHADMLKQLYPQSTITLAGLWLPKPRAYIHDPFNTNVQFFNYCEQQVMAGVGGILGQTA